MPRPETAAETVAEVRGVFAEKCSGCHGPDSLRPKGRFGYVLDLHRIAENPEMVIPSIPTNRNYGTRQDTVKCHRPDSPHGPLSEAQKNIVRAWIADGARDLQPLAAVGTAPRAAPKRATEPKRSQVLLTNHWRSSCGCPPQTGSPVPSSLIPSKLLWFGKLPSVGHPFPDCTHDRGGHRRTLVGLAGSRVHLQSVSFCIRLAAIAALPTVILGWLYAAAGNGPARRNF